MKLVVYLVDEDQNPEGFQNTLVSVSDLLQLMMDAGRIGPLLHLVGEGIAPGVTSAVNAGSGQPNTDNGVLRNSIELLNDVMILHTQRPTVLSRILRNAVADTPEGKSPVETVIDMISEVERTDPKQPASATLLRPDFQSIADSAYQFMHDDQHGLERLFAVIKNRTVHPPEEADIPGVTSAADAAVSASSPAPASSSDASTNPQGP
jgi:hypothetical protein